MIFPVVPVFYQRGGRWMECYGTKSYGRKEQCKTCDMAAYCKDAGDPPFISQIDIDTVKIPVEPTEPIDPEESPSPGTSQEPLYTTAQLSDLIITLIDLADDYRIREIIKQKIRNPDVSLQQIAERFNVRKQAIGKEIQTVVRAYPILKLVLQNRPLYNRWRKTRPVLTKRLVHRKKRLMRNSPFEQLTFEF